MLSEKMNKDKNPSKIYIKNMEELAEEEKHPAKACVDGDARGSQYYGSHGRRPGQEEGRSAVYDGISG